jgi:hypothetical protein
MKSLAFRTLVRDDIIGIHADRCIPLGSLYHRAVEQGERPFYAGSVGKGPFDAALVNGIIGTFGLTGAAIDTFFGYLNSHILNIGDD